MIFKDWDMTECDLITREIEIKRRRRQLVGRENEFPEEIADIKVMERSLANDRQALYQPASQNVSKEGPRL